MKCLVISLALFVSSLATAAGLEVTAANTEVWALPASTKSCVAWKNGSAENDIPGKHVNLGNLTFAWADTERPLVISAVTISLRDKRLPGGAYECVIKGAELDALGAPGWTSIPKAAKNGGARIQDTDCLLVCGGIEFNPDEMATASGKLEAKGYATDVHGNREEITAGQSITVDNVTF
jgi:hypothetical protein